MVLKLIGHAWSTSTKRVLAILKETNTPFEFKEISWVKAEHKSPKFAEKQPFNQIPYLDDDGLIVYESRAIARYIAAKANSPLLPAGDLLKVTAFEQAISIESCEFDPFASHLVYERTWKPMSGAGKTDEKRVQELATMLEGKLAGYERILTKQKYLAGDEVTLADLFHLPYGSQLAEQGFKWLEDEDKFPNVARWWKDITSRPSWQSLASKSKKW